MKITNSASCEACLTPGRCLPRDLDIKELMPGRYRQCVGVSADRLVIAAAPKPLLTPAGLRVWEDDED